MYTKSANQQLQVDIARANSQYPTFKEINFSKAHDRFIVLDEIEVYHLGASLKDLGKKWFAFSKIENDSAAILKTIKQYLKGG
ncbi:MAG: hypothetical protein PHQ74_11490 [Crocinitomicaceae bacterium]|nr:hypothetical protein [Crocinitomicaceae bacterium]